MNGLATTQRQGVACAGNWVLDTIHTLSHWPEKSGLALISAQHIGLGGGPANVAVGLKAMKAQYPVLPIGLIGAGALGDEVVRLCHEAGLPAEELRRTSRATTSQTHVMNVPGDSRTFFHHPGANALLDASAFDIDRLTARKVKLLYLGYLTLLDALDAIGPDGRTVAGHLLARARAQGIMTCVDLASFASPAYRATVEATLPDIDILFANELEAGLATGLELVGDADLDGMIRAARVLKSGGVRTGVVIHSPARVIWCGHGYEHVMEPDPIPAERVISAVGAGDAFAAGVMHGIHEDWPIESSLNFGTHVAAACLSGYTATDGLTGLSLPEAPP